LLQPYGISKTGLSIKERKTTQVETVTGVIIMGYEGSEDEMYNYILSRK